MKALRKPFVILFLAVIAAGAAGCGPGAMIMTGEQESIADNLNRLVKENEALRRRVSALESGDSANAGQLKDEMASLKKTVAETNVNIDNIRQQLSFVQGSIEKSDFDTSQSKESISAINSSFSAVTKRLTALENAQKETAKRLDALKSSLDENRQKLSGLQDAQTALDRKTASIDGRAASLETKVSGLSTDVSKVSTDLTRVSTEAAEARKAAAETPSSLYQRGNQEREGKEFAKALETYQDFLTKYPDDKLADHAQYWIGEIYYARGDWERAILEFDKVIKNYPQGDKVAASILKQGFSFEKLGSLKEAKALLSQVVEKFPKSQEADLAKSKLEQIK